MVKSKSKPKSKSKRRQTSKSNKHNSAHSPSSSSKMILKDGVSSPQKGETKRLGRTNNETKTPCDKRQDEPSVPGTVSTGPSSPSFHSCNSTNSNNEGREGPNRASLQVSSDQHPRSTGNVSSEEFEMLKNMVFSLSTQVGDQGKEIKTLKSDNKTLKSENKTLKARVSQLEDENKTLKTRVSQLEDENKTLKAWVSQLEDENKTLKTRVSQLEDENKTLKTRVSQLEDENESLKATVSEHKEKIRRHYEAILKLKSEHEKMANNNTQLTDEVATLKETLESLAKIVDEWQFHTTLAEIGDEASGEIHETLLEHYPLLQPLNSKSTADLRHKLAKAKKLKKLAMESNPQGTGFPLKYIDEFDDACKSLKQHRNKINHSKYPGHRTAAINELFSRLKSRIRNKDLAAWPVVKDCLNAIIDKSDTIQGSPTNASQSSGH